MSWRTDRARPGGIALDTIDTLSDARQESASACASLRRHAVSVRAARFFQSSAVVQPSGGLISRFFALCPIPVASMAAATQARGSFSKPQSFSMWSAINCSRCSVFGPSVMVIVRLRADLVVLLMHTRYHCSTWNTSNKSIYLFTCHACLARSVLFIRRGSARNERRATGAKREGQRSRSLPSIAISAAGSHSALKVTRDG